jgi:hypothetical protein
MKDFFDFFKSKNVPDRNSRLRADTTNARYSSILKVVNEELKSTTGAFNAEELDEFLFDNLFYSNNNYHYAYRLENLFFTTETTEQQVEAFFANNPSLNYKKLLTDVSVSDYELCTLRSEFSDGKLTSIKMLIKVETISTRSIPAIDMFSAVLIDLANKMVIFKFNLNHLDNIRKDPLDLLSILKKILHGEGTSWKIFNPIQINITSLNEEASKETIFKLFEELSLEAEELLDAQTLPDTEKNIENFLKEMGLREVTEDYIQQIKAVIYQEISNTIKDSIFEKGWVFRFVFREGQTTRASTRTDDRGPIYGSKVYWHLKELIFKETKMIESGFHWHIKNNTGEDDYVQVRLESRSDTIIMHYYYNMRYGRKEKEDFVVRKINEYLP